MRILALDCAVGFCSVTIVNAATVLASRERAEARDHAAHLAVMVCDCLAESALTAGQLDGIAVTVGPGSFTGIRTGLALAQGLSVATGRPIAAVTVGEALTEALRGVTVRPVWCVTESRRGRIFLETMDGVQSLVTDAIPQPAHPIALAGPAAAEAASRLAARGANVLLSNVFFPPGISIATVGARRLSGAIAPLAAEPLYIDAPEAKPRQKTDAPPT